jgi:hypothetical protein
MTQTANTLALRNWWYQGTRLQLGLGLGLLENRLELGSLHDIALDLHTAAHEHLLSVCLAGNELAEVSVGEDEGDCVMFC